MPVTFTVASHNPEPSKLPEYKSADKILDWACSSSKKELEKFEVLQSSINPTDYPSIHPAPNGFVHTVLESYGQHRNLIIRPDDVWMAILTQFHFYVNANAEQLRGSFVAHEGKKHLVIDMPGDRYSVDFGSLAVQMSGLLHENVVDKDLVRWILPGFSTTTVTDTTVCAVILMSTLKAYFTYGFGIVCGIPKVTLAGEKEDWIDVLSRLDKLADFGDEPHAWSHLLRAVITRFISAFDSPDSASNIDFWQRIAHRSSPICGVEYLSGWITAFCAWNKEGKWIGPDVAEILKGGVIDEPQPQSPDRWDATPERLILDGRPFSHINFGSVPPGYASVPVKVEEDDYEMIAGHIGWHVHSAANPIRPSEANTPTTGVEEKDTTPVFGDTVQPASAWFIFETKRDLEKELERKKLYESLGMTYSEDEMDY